MKKLIYAGVGARITPQPILGSMELLGEQLAESGWLLRSGYADGADQAFARGADRADTVDHRGDFTMYLPWEGFNRAPRDDSRFLVPVWTAEMIDIAATAHPAWGNLTWGAKCMMTRNVAQVLGEDLQTPATMVICYTPGGRGGGGTGQAIRIAKRFDIPVYDLGSKDDQKALVEFINSVEKMV